MQMKFEIITLTRNEEVLSIIYICLVPELSPSWLLMDQASSLVFPWESSFRDGGSGRGSICKAHYVTRVDTVLAKNLSRSQRNHLTFEID